MRPPRFKGAKIVIPFSSPFNNTQKNEKREKKREATFLTHFFGILPSQRSGCCSGTMKLERGCMKHETRNGGIVYEFETGMES